MSFLTIWGLIDQKWPVFYWNCLHHSSSWPSQFGHHFHTPNSNLDSLETITFTHHCSDCYILSNFGPYGVFTGLLSGGSTANIGSLGLNGGKIMVSWLHDPLLIPSFFVESFRPFTREPVLGIGKRLYGWLVSIGTLWASISGNPVVTFEFEFWSWRSTPGSNFWRVQNIRTSVTPSIFERGAISKLYTYAKAFVEY